MGDYQQCSVKHKLSAQALCPTPLYPIKVQGPATLQAVKEGIFRCVVHTKCLHLVQMWDVIIFCDIMQFLHCEPVVVVVSELNA